MAISEEITVASFCGMHCTSAIVLIDVPDLPFVRYETITVLQNRGSHQAISSSENILSIDYNISVLLCGINQGFLFPVTPFILKSGSNSWFWQETNVDLVRFLSALNRFQIEQIDGKKLGFMGSFLLEMVWNV